MHNALQTLVFGSNGIASKAACKRRSPCVQMAIEDSPKRLSGLTKLSPSAIGQEHYNGGDDVYIHYN